MILTQGVTERVGLVLKKTWVNNIASIQGYENTMPDLPNLSISLSTS